MCAMLDKTYNQNISKLNLTREEILLIESFCKIFKKDRKQIEELVDFELFVDCDFHLARVFECLGKVF